MAKAKEITGLDCGADAFQWAAEILRVRFDEVFSLRETALDYSDTEGVHSMRVATRRLRSALRDFMPLMEQRPSKKLKKKLKQLADALGAVRDLDVTIIALEELQAEAETELIKEGIGKLLKERDKRRKTARLYLTETLTVNNLNDLQEQFTAAIIKAAKVKHSREIITFNEAGRRLIADRWENLHDLGTSFYEPFNVERLHKLRIAAKHLRYAIQLFVVCWGERIAPFADEIAGLQSFLGEVHDCDIWINSLSERLRDAKEKTMTDDNDYQAAVWLLSEFVKKRTKQYRSALKLWSQWEADHFFERMQSAIIEN